MEIRLSSILSFILATIVLGEILGFLIWQSRSQPNFKSFTNKFNMLLSGCFFGLAINCYNEGFSDFSSTLVHGVVAGIGTCFMMSSYMYLIFLRTRALLVMRRGEVFVRYMTNFGIFLNVCNVFLSGFGVSIAGEIAVSDLVWALVALIVITLDMYYMYIFARAMSQIKEVIRTLGPEMGIIVKYGTICEILSALTFISYGVFTVIGRENGKLVYLITTLLMNFMGLSLLGMKIAIAQKTSSNRG